MATLSPIEIAVIFLSCHIIADVTRIITKPLTTMKLWQLLDLLLKPALHLAIR